MQQCAKADFLAEEGYTVLVPDLYWRQAAGVELGYTAEDHEKAFELYKHFDVESSIKDIQASLTTLGQLQVCDTTVGLSVVGYCLGGKLAYLAACRIATLAAVSYYGVELNSICMKRRIFVPEPYYILQA